MARAKRTDRAEARRRYRAQLAEESVEQDGEGAEAEAAPAAGSDARLLPRRPVPSSRTAAARGSATPAPQRGLGFMGAMRTAYQPWRPREDLRLTRSLVTQTHAVWVPAALALAAAVLYISGIAGSNVWAQAFAGYVLASPVAPPMAGPFVAGVLTPRAGWLAGLIAALIAWLVTVLLIASGTIVAYNAQNERIATGLNEALSFGGVALLWVPFGAVVGAFAAWYRRFLSLSSPARQARANARQAPRGKATPRRAVPRR